MPQECPIQPNDKSSITVTVDFLDGDGAAFTPKTLGWKLVKSDGTLVNSRNVTVSPPANPLTVELYNNDLDYATANEVYLLIEATYDSATTADKTFKESYKITIQDLPGVS